MQQNMYGVGFNNNTVFHKIRLKELAARPIHFKTLCIP